MATKKEGNDALVQFFAGVQAGRPVFPEDAKRAAAAAGLDQEAIDRAVTSPQDVFEWTDAGAFQAQVPLNVPESLVSGENAAAEDIKKVQITKEENTATGSNDPDENALATGKAQTDDDGNPVAVGSSGQVRP